MALAFACIGLPYILTALLMTFLHDDELAATPLAVLTALFQLGSSFLFLCVFLAFLIAAGAGSFVAGVLAARCSLQDLPARLCRLLGVSSSGSRSS